MFFLTRCANIRWYTYVVRVLSVGTSLRALEPDSICYLLTDTTYYRCIKLYHYCHHDRHRVRHDAPGTVVFALWDLKRLRKPVSSN